MSEFYWLNTPPVQLPHLPGTRSRLNCSRGPDSTSALPLWCRRDDIITGGVMYDTGRAMYIPVLCAPVSERVITNMAGVAARV